MDHPKNDQLEVTIIGPAYGESIAVHLGNRNWMLVDSCEDVSGTPMLEHLAELGVDVASEVRLVVATHYHDDHLRGIDTLLRAAESAFLVCSAAFDDRAGQALLGAEALARLNRTGPGSRSQGPGFRSMFDAMKVLQERKAAHPGAKVIQVAQAGSLLFDDGETVVRALSPSSEGLLAAIGHLAALASPGVDRNVASRPNANHAAIVLWVERSGQGILLGADLESHPNPQQGWLHVLDEPGIRPQVQAGLVKAPHHGAKSADEPRVWAEMVADNPVTLICPWVNGGHALPTVDDLQRLRARSSSVWLSGEARGEMRPTAAPSAIEEWELPRPGRVTARRSPAEMSWTVQHVPPAHQA